MSLSEIASCLNLINCESDIILTGVCTDSRQCKKGDLFICIEGERVDGHEFSQAAVERGACAILAQKPVRVGDIPVLLVSDTVRALGRLAACWRLKSKARVLGITGTAGKTTLKETLASILSRAGSIAITEKNHNNQIGMPCAILASNGDEDWWIMEVGISKARDMEELGDILKPDVAIVLNIASGHTEGLGDKGVAWHKSRIFNYLPKDGIALASGDYPDLIKECENLGRQINYFSIKNMDAKWHLVRNGQEKGEYLFSLNGEIEKFSTPFMGEYGAETALASIACAKLLGIRMEDIKKGLAMAQMPEQRLKAQTLGGWSIFDDTYNANPLSMRRMIQAVAESAAGKALILVLGEMGELGKEAACQHYELGKLCGKINPAAIFWHGAFKNEILNGLHEENPAYKNFYPVGNPEDFGKKWKDVKEISKVSAGAILFKGSRSNRMERFLEAFRNLCKGEGDVL